MTTLVKAYEQAGHTNPKWDEPAKLALTEFARSRAKIADTDPAVISANVTTAIRAGCDDPMVNYLYIKYALDQSTSKEAVTKAFCKVAKEMQQSSYPPIRKFYAAFRAVNQFTWANNYPRQLPPEIADLNRQINDNMGVLIEDQTLPDEEIYDVCHEFLEMWKGDKDAYQTYYKRTETSLFQNWPNASTSWLLKGEAYLQMAWLARGGGYADKVAPEGWKLFTENLATAETALKKAWEINPRDERVPTIMIRVDEGQQKNRDDMELWFDRAMALNPNNYEACKNKLHYLYPQWYGSRTEMIAFGKQCVASTNWGGFVPLVLVDAHTDYNLFSQASEEEKQTYWKQPEIWPDLMAAYERFFELNPDAFGYYHNYLWYAYKCQQWAKVNELLPKLGPVNYSYFGGQDEFDKIVRLAKENADKVK